MDKVSYPVDYKNSYIGSSGDAGPAIKTQGTRAMATRDISSMMGV